MERVFCQDVKRVCAMLQAHSRFTRGRGLSWAWSDRMTGSEMDYLFLFFVFC